MVKRKRDKTIRCRLTGDIAKPVKAHIIPKAFYELESQSEGVSKLVGTEENFYSKKTPTGIYDGQIVSQKGEDIFSSLDDYAIKLLLGNEEQLVERHSSGELVGWEFMEYNYKSLKLFFLSLLWRAHITTHEFFQNIDLGPHEEKIREMIVSGNPGDPQQYSVIVFRWTSNEFGPIIQNPYRLRKEGINLYKFYLGRYLFFIKVDQKVTPPILSELMIKPDSALQIIAKDLQSSSDWDVMLKIARKL